LEIKINKEIRSYHETIFFGLTFRQFICSFIAVGAALLIYFGLKSHVNDEVLSWLCIVCAAPIAAAGFFQYNGLYLGQFLWAVIKSEFIFTGRRVYKSENIYYKLLSEGKCEHEHKKHFWFFKRNRDARRI
jgi:hypothetical protein